MLHTPTCEYPEGQNILVAHDIDRRHNRRIGGLDIIHCPIEELADCRNYRTDALTSFAEGELRVYGFTTDSVKAWLTREPLLLAPNSCVMHEFTADGLHLPPQAEQEIVWVTENTNWWERTLEVTNTVTGVSSLYMHMG